MKKLLIVVLAALVTAPAMAANLAPRVYKRARPVVVAVPLYSWTGFYVGVNAGYARNNIHTIGEGTAPVSAVPSPQDFSSSGWLAGAQLGANYQWQHLVIGAEADIQGSHVDGDSALTFITPLRNGVPCGIICLGTRTYDSNMRSFETVRGRLGIAFDRILVYGTGGVMWANLEESANWVFPNPPPGGTFPASSTRTGSGGVWGGGLEYAFLNNLSAKVEALGYRLGTDSFLGNGTGNGVGTSALYTTETKGWLIRGGLNYKFGYAGLPAVYK